MNTQKVILQNIYVFEKYLTNDFFSQQRKSFWHQLKTKKLHDQTLILNINVIQNSMALQQCSAYNKIKKTIKKLNKQKTNAMTKQRILDKPGYWWTLPSCLQLFDWEFFCVVTSISQSQSQLWECIDPICFLTQSRSYLINSQTQAEMNEVNIQGEMHTHFVVRYNKQITLSADNAHCCQETVILFEGIITVVLRNQIFFFLLWMAAVF